jgi:hypothetical protein
MYLVEARNTRGNTVATSIGLSTERDVSAVVICIRASAGWETITGTVVATNTAGGNNLNAAVDSRLRANGCGNRGIRAVEKLTHISED